jgi:hypothetical protein
VASKERCDKRLAEIKDGKRHWHRFTLLLIGLVVLGLYGSF